MGNGGTFCETDCGSEMDSSIAAFGRRKLVLAESDEQVTTCCCLANTSAESSCAPVCIPAAGSSTGNGDDEDAGDEGAGDEGAGDDDVGVTELPNRKASDGNSSRSSCEGWCLSADAIRIGGLASEVSTGDDRGVAEADTVVVEFGT